jgi:hypothetical protein
MKALALALLLAPSLFANDVWVIGGKATSQAVDGCTATMWTGDAVFQNTTNAPAVISVLSSDLILAPPIPVTFTLAPGKTTTFATQRSANPTKFFTPIAPVWIDHFDVPEGVVVEGRIEIGASVCNVSPPIFGPVNGKVSTPTFHSLVAANTLQRHLGTDIGLIDARVNVGVYNGGDLRANAHVEVRRACNDALLASTNVSVERNSLVQVSLNPGAPQVACSSADAPGWVTYTTVSVDQPSLTFASTISNGTSQPMGTVFVPYAIAQ